MHLKFRTLTLCRLISKKVEKLEERVKEIQRTPFSSENDIDDFEDAYVQLVLETTEMTNAEESKIFGDQTLFCLSSTMVNTSLVACSISPESTWRKSR